MAGAGSIFYTYLRRIATICTLGKEISWCAWNIWPVHYRKRYFYGLCSCISISCNLLSQSRTLILGLATAAWIFSNFLIHASYTLYTGEYSPGVVTASAIYAPVSLYIYYSLWASGIVNTLDIILSIFIGFAVMYVPTLIQIKRKGKI